MSALESEIKRYKKKGYEVRQKRTLKHGTRVFLAKERGGVSGFLVGGFNGLYVYYVEGDSDTNSIREFLKDYNKFYENNDLRARARPSNSARLLERTLDFVTLNPFVLRNGYAFFSNASPFL